MQVAQTILAQFGGKMFIMMTGASNLVGSEKSLSFKIGKNAKGVTHVRVELTPADLYDIKFLRVRGTNVKTVAEAEGIYADQLRSTFTEETGLYTSL